MGEAFDDLHERIEIGYLKGRAECPCGWGQAECPGRPVALGEGAQFRPAAKVADLQIVQIGVIERRTMKLEPDTLIGHLDEAHVKPLVASWTKPTDFERLGIIVMVGIQAHLVAAFFTARRFDKFSN